MTDKYVVIGNPVAHSQSPFIHGEFAKQMQLDIDYSTLLSPLDSFKDTVTEFATAGGLGANVTVPFKEQAAKLCYFLSDTAKSASAVNTLTVTQDGKLKGDNTDGYGLVTDLQSQFGALEDKRVLILGAGGATRGSLFPLLNEKVRHIVIANRTESKANQLVQEFGAERLSTSSLANLAKLPEFDLIINATSASLNGEIPRISADLIHSNIHCYDMAYGSKPTAFLVWAKANKARNIADGLGMLVHQAAKSFQIWRGVEPNAQVVLETLRARLR